MVCVCEPVSNSLLISVAPKIADGLVRYVLKLDARPRVVTMNVCIAEFAPREGDASVTRKSATVHKDGAAWLAWAKEHGDLEILMQPQIATTENTTATIEVGETVPASGAKSSPTMFVGDVFSLAPAISSHGRINVALDFRKTAFLDDRSGAIKKLCIHSLISAKDGQTTVVEMPMDAENKGGQSVIVAVTPHVDSGEAKKDVAAVSKALTK